MSNNFIKSLECLLGYRNNDSLNAEMKRGFGQG